MILSCIALSRAAVIPLASSGSSSVSRSEDVSDTHFDVTFNFFITEFNYYFQNAGNYAFAYDEAHATGGSFRRESGLGGQAVQGSYGLRDADGRVRTVNYIADAAGFRASISSNEPGVEPKDPANTLINKGPIVAAPAAPLVARAPVLAAPVIAAAPAISGISYSSTVNHAIPAPLIAAPAPLIAAPAPVVAAAPALSWAHSSPW